MSFNSINSLLDKAVSVANAAGKKTEEVVEVSKLKLQEASLNADISNCYDELGKLRYNEKQFDIKDVEKEEDLVGQIQVLLEELAELKNKCEEIRKVRKCPNCGAACNVESHFCSRCGMMLAPEAVEVVKTEPKPQPQNVAEEATEETVKEASEVTEETTEE